MGCNQSSVAADIIDPKSMSPTVFHTPSSRTHIFDHHQAEIPENFTIPEIQVFNSTPPHERKLQNSSG